MSTIREVVTAHLPDVDVDVLVGALVEREQSMIDDLTIVASRFGVMPQIMAKVVMDMGFGEEKSPEFRDLITAQYDSLVAQMIEGLVAQGVPREAIGFPSTTVEDDLPEVGEPPTE